jgi:Tol biopolymer transport system component
MRRPPSRRVLAATLVALAALAAGSEAGAGASRSASPGVIVFASDRTKNNPGEIYSLAPGTAPRDVSRSLAGEHDLAVAPRGDRIAFWSDRTGFDRLYLSRSDGSRVRLVRGIGDEQSATDQGDGGQITFSSGAAMLVASFYAHNESHDFVIDPRTATAHLLPPCGSVIEPSPDGRLIACGRGGTGAIGVYDLAGRMRFKLPISTPIWSSRGLLTGSPSSGPTRRGGSVVVVDESGRTVGRLTGEPLAWSPDGRLLLFGRGHSLLLGDPRDSGRARVLLPHWSTYPASITPDGRYVSTSDSAGKPVLVPLEGGAAIAGPLAANGVWSGAGRLAYVGQPSSTPERPGVTIPVLVTDTRGRNPRVAGRFPFDDHAGRELHWLPDGRRVLFVTANSCNGDDLFAVSPGGGTTRQLTHDPRDLEQPTWSPDAARIAYAAGDFSCHLGAGGPVHLETVKADGSGVQRVTDDGDRNQGSFDGSPSFSPDGTQIVLSHGTLDTLSLATVGAGGGARTTLLPPAAGWSGAPAWSPDGSRIAYVAEDSSIHAIAPGGGTPELIAASPESSADVCGRGGLAWSPDGKLLAVGGGAGIYLITLGQPGSTRLAIPAPCAEYPSFSPDGSQIAFDAPPPKHLGEQSAIMVAGADGTNVRILSTVPFRQSVHPTWQPGA